MKFFLLTVVAISCAATSRGEAPWEYSSAQLRPFWVGDTVEGESILFIKDPETGSATGSLLFPVKSVVSVRNSAGTTTYEEGRDYRWNPDSREIELPKGSRIVAVTPSQLRRPAGSQRHRLTHRDGSGEILFGAKLEYHTLQTVVSYTHDPGLWKSPVPDFEETSLPRSIGKLREAKPLSIVVLGDSISTGCNASGWAEGEPHQPAYPQLLARHLEEVYESKITLTNLSIGGKRSAWGITMAEAVATAKPDLVIVAFGMNDSAGVPAADYKANTAAIIAKTRELVPEAEFVLVASMLGNRDWTVLKHESFVPFRDVLEELSEPGVALADMTSIWSEFLTLKKDWDLTGNGVNHPNDFGHRVYAQVISSLLVAPGPSEN
ncbi:MAG: acyl-CoA thioesterase-1 [Verrucomicrobiales bacterium]|jgi:acyl-CoA thioesterase-1